ncbi:hypothetical protein LTR60_001651, partial [Cryomyces antarcticus]
MSLILFSLQALLVRHETYIADAERERKRMNASIESLEQEKQELEAKNTTIIVENRCLLNELEELNSAVTESDSHVRSLEATLASTKQELQRLNALAYRTERLEQQLASLEKDHDQLQNTLRNTEEGERSAIQRLKKAELTLADLHDQIEVMEREAREERERHAEVVRRIERRSTVERGIAAETLDGAAANAVGRDKPGNNTVSHFVKDIMQDNASLQLAIVELREMLLNSTGDVEKLREQLVEHQPVEQSRAAYQPTSLKDDLRLETSRALSQELHVHHHYHSPATPPTETPFKSRVQTYRRSSKKRNIITPGYFTPRSGGQTARTPTSHTRSTTPSPVAPTLSRSSRTDELFFSEDSNLSTTPRHALTLSNDEVLHTMPSQHQRRNHWSLQSNTTGSTAPSSGVTSPYSTLHRTSSIFDRAFGTASIESSRPTSPDSEDPGSPMSRSMNTSRTPKAPVRSLARCGSFQRATEQRAAAATKRVGAPEDPQEEEMFSKTHVDVDLGPPTHSRIIEETPEDLTSEVISPFDADSDPNLTPTQAFDTREEQTYSNLPARPALRRATSHESLLSISGMDIHTSSHRPSYLLASRAFPRPAVLSSSKPLLNSVTATAARPAMPHRYGSST